MIDPRTTLVLVRNRSLQWENKTSEIAGVEERDHQVVIEFANSRGKPYRYGRDRVLIAQQPQSVPIPAGARIAIDGELRFPADAELELREFCTPIGSWRVLTRHIAQEITHTAYAADSVRVIPDAGRTRRAREVMGYWRTIVASRPDDDPIVRAYASLDFVHPESALARYLARAPIESEARTSPALSPFASNLSQRAALNTSLTHPLSVIDGPPGTGKTETILNLIANIAADDRGSVAVVSFTNAAVDNVREKLEEQGLGHIVANLGSRAKMEEFFAGQEERERQVVEFLRTASDEPPSEAELAAADNRLVAVLAAQRERAEVRERVDAYRIERRHFERLLQHHATAPLEDLPLLRKSSKRLVEFLAETNREPARVGFFSRLRRYLRYGRLGGVDTADSAVILRLQQAFYERRIHELEARLAELERSLALADDATLARDYRELSRRMLASALARRYGKLKRRSYTQLPTHPRGFESFCRDYPVLLSTCHSLRRRLPPGHLLDYLIIDEASQVDLLSASLAMAACRHLVIVGDLHQLPHIPGDVPSDLRAAADAYDFERHSVLSSVTELYGAELPRTLLREHYRCHPAIIGFCNTAFYDGQLIPCTSSDDRAEPAMWIHRTAPGNHMRGRANQREIDVIAQEVLAATPPGIAHADVAVLAPFRVQVERASDSLGDLVAIVDTVHKLQGRQQRMVILSTVLSETREGRRRLAFVDDPRLVNVAVSRAVDHFVLVTNHDALPSSRHVRDLAGYIEYRYPDQQPEASQVISVFDLLYREYSAALRPIAARISRDAKIPSEEIMHVVLEDILAEAEFRHLDAHRQVAMAHLVVNPSALPDEHRGLVQRGSTVDFVIYNRISRQALLAIEVDGTAFHAEDPVQLQRDAMKDDILHHIGLPILRLPTDGSGEEIKIRHALRRTTDLSQAA